MTSVLNTKNIVLSVISYSLFGICLVILFVLEDVKKYNKIFSIINIIAFIFLFINLIIGIIRNKEIKDDEEYKSGKTILIILIIMNSIFLLVTMGLLGYNIYNYLNIDEPIYSLASSTNNPTYDNANNNPNNPYYSVANNDDNYGYMNMDQ